MYPRKNFQIYSMESTVIVHLFGVCEKMWGLVLIAVSISLCFGDIIAQQMIKITCINTAY